MAEDVTLKPVTVVTGGSEGIGLALALRFARGGHDVMLVARHRETLDEAAEEIRTKTARRVYILAADLTAPEGCAAVETALADNGLYADILINNAGAGLGREFASQDHARLMQLIDLNVRALTDLTRRFLPGMLERGEGGVLNVGSLGGYMPGPYQAAYYASKAYVVSFTKAIAYEVSGSGVRVSALMPGPVPTKFHERMGSQSAPYMWLGVLARPDAVASLAYLGFKGRLTVIIPGILPIFGALAAWVLPHFLLVPVIGWFLKKRY